MTVQDLEQAIHDYILTIYHKEYIGKLEITKLNPIGYCVKLGMDISDQPITIYAELEDEKYLKFLKQELKDRRFNLSYFGKLSLKYPYECNPINTECNCNDERGINRKNR